MKTFHVGGMNPLRRYRSLEEALKNVQDDDTIELHKNCTFSGVVSKNIILEGHGHTIKVESGKVGLSCDAPIVIRDLTLLCDPRANGAILQKGGRLQNVTTKTEGPARVLFPTLVCKGGKLQIQDCTLQKISCEVNSDVTAENTTFQDYYGGVFHLPGHENLSLFQGKTSFTNCKVSCCFFQGTSRLSSCTLGVFNTNIGDLVLSGCSLEPTLNEPTVNLKKEPADGPLEYKNENSKFVLEQRDGTCKVSNYVSRIPEVFVGFHILKGSLDIQNTENHDTGGYHIIRNASVSFLDTVDDAYYEINGGTLSQVRSQVSTSIQSETALEKLDKLVGLRAVKEKVHSIVNTIKVNQQGKESDKNFGFSYHMIFAGDPGTGKTTVAKIVAQALFEVGAIPENKCTQVSVDSLVKGYVGQTAGHVREVLDEALGGVLFIDEAYELTVKDNQNSFNSEVLSVLIRYMEDYRDQLVVIAAGYEKEMKEFIASNVGLSRRFQWVHFEDYTPKEMAQIFEMMRASYEEEYEQEKLSVLIPQYFEKLTGLYLRKPDAKGRITNGGNGGLVRNALQQILQARNNRIVEHPGETRTITQADLNAGFRKEMEKAIQI